VIKSPFREVRLQKRSVTTVLVVRLDWQNDREEWSCADPGSNVKLLVNQTSDTGPLTAEDCQVMQRLSSTWRIVSGWQTVGRGRSIKTRFLQRSYESITRTTSFVRQVKLL